MTVNPIDRFDIHARGALERATEIRVQLAQDDRRVQVRPKEKQLATRHRPRRRFDRFGINTTTIYCNKHVYVTYALIIFII